MRTAISATMTRLLVFLGVIFFAWMTYQAFRNTATWTGSNWTTAGILLLAAIVMIVLGYAVNRYLTRTQAIAAVLVVAAGLRFGWILYVDTQPVSDFLDMYSAAQSAVRGDFSFGTSEYFTRWVYQLGFTIYEALLLSLFGDSLMVLKVFNVLFNTATAAVIYATAARLFGEWSGRAAALAFALYVPQIMMCSVLTNQHISTFFFFLGMYLAVRDQREASWYRWVLIGLCFGAGNLMRPLGSAFVAAYLAFVILYGLLPRREGAIAIPQWKTLVKAIGVAVVYLIVQQAASLSLQTSGVTPYPLANSEPYYKFMVGVNPVTNGGWSLEDNMYVTQYPSGEERNEATRRLLMERLENKPQLVELLVRKLKIMWGDEDSAYMWSLWQQDRPELQRFMIQGERIGYLLMSVFGLIAMVSLLFAKRKKDRDVPTYPLFVLLVLGYATIHIAIEIQTRYRMDIMPALFILQSYGICRMCVRIGTLRITSPQAPDKEHTE